jgi:hypothetical protein
VINEDNYLDENRVLWCAITRPEKALGWQGSEVAGQSARRDGFFLDAILTIFVFFHPILLIELSSPKQL